MSMYVTSKGIKEDGYYEDKYGFKGSAENNYSVPLKFTMHLEGTVSFVVFLEDRMRCHLLDFHGFIGQLQI